MTIRINKENEKRMKGLLASGKCLGCERKLVSGERVTRGQCATCYQGSRHVIRKGRITEEELLREGKLLEAAHGGRRPANKFTQELAELKK